MRVLVTGSSGLIGSNIIKLLKHKFDFIGLDITKNNQSPDIPTIFSDAVNINGITDNIKNVDAIIHLAANPSVHTSWENALSNNISLTHNIFETAKNIGIKKIIFASSNHAVGNFEMDIPYSKIVKGDYKKLSPGKYKLIDHRVPIRPDSQYGISKAFGEATGRYYHEHHNMDVSCLRIGTFNAENKPNNIRSLSTWVSYRDLSHMIEMCLLNQKGFEIFYGVSDNLWKIWDIEHAKSTIGYKPLDNAEIYRTK